MKKPDHFPFEYSAAGLVFRVHRASQERVLRNGNAAEYESFLLSYYVGGDRVQKRRNSWEDIYTLIEDAVTAERQKDPERLELTGRDRRVYLAAVEALAPCHREVDGAARDYASAAQVLSPFGMDVRQGAQVLAEALKELKGRSVSEAVAFYKRHEAADVIPRTVLEVLRELLEEKKADGAGEYHRRDLETRVGRFANSFPDQIASITEPQITGWLQNLKKPGRDGTETDCPVGSRTRNNYRDAVAELFAFAKKRNYLPRDLETAGESTKRVKVVPSDNHVIPPEALQKLLDALPAKLIVPVVLKNFCGLRTEENHPFRWEYLRQESRAIVIRAELAKLSQRRAPPILPNLAKWLSPFQGLKGPINPDYLTPQTLYQAVKRCADRVGVELKRNTFRNCYISYRVAQPYPVALVAQETGTSVKMIESNYRELVTAKEAARWFAIVPSPKQLKALRQYADEIRKKMAQEERGEPAKKATKR